MAARLVALGLEVADQLEAGVGGGGDEPLGSGAAAARARLPLGRFGHPTIIHVIRASPFRGRAEARPSPP